MTSHSVPQAAAALRQFNRFYTAQIGVLDQGLLGSNRSLTEARVLYELAMRDGLTAGDLSRELGLDPGYLSRMLAAFEKEGLLERRKSPQDGRVSHLAMTAKGRTAFAALDKLSQGAAESLVARLGAAERGAFLLALSTIETVLAADAPPALTIIRPHEIGDMGWIVHRQALLYAHDYGWTIDYEALILEICGEFLRSFKSGRERGFIAERDGAILGSVLAVESSADVARLRLLYVEPSARGQGIGRKLVESCIDFARDAGYSRLDLWTNDILVSARKIYQACGFQLVGEEAHRSFGHELTGQTWSLALREEANC